MRTSKSLLTLLAALAALSLVLLTACGSSDDGDSSTTEPATTAAETGPCKAVDAPPSKGEQSLRKPTLKLDPSKTWTATVTTNCGSFTIELDAKRAPKTTASFASLVKQGFYDDLTFHRIAPGFVIQGGDPLGNGTGGPGYTIVEQPPADLQYTYGVVAMAKAGNEPDGASGSQFFVVTGQDGGLPPQYALLGRVTDGLDVVDTIGVVPIDPNDPNQSAPAEPVVIESITLQSR